MARKKDVDEEAALPSASSRQERRRYNHPKSIVNKSLKYSQENADHFVNFRKQLAALGLMLRDILGDGNCLFRALGDQLDGHDRNHLLHRRQTVNFMLQHRKDFEPFVSDEEISFERHMDNLNAPGTYGGQECLVAFARMHACNIVIHQLNSPLWQIEGCVAKNASELHLSYHNGEHYSSVRKAGDLSDKPADVKLTPKALAVSSVKRPDSAEDFPGCSSALEHVAGGEELLTNSGADDDLVQLVMDLSGCTDSGLAEQTLSDHQYNAELAVDFLVNLTLLTKGNSDVLCNEDPSHLTSLAIAADSPAAGQRPALEPKLEPNQTEQRKKLPVQKHCSNKQRKDQHRKEKAQRQQNRRDKAVAYEEETVEELSQNVSCLNL